MIILIRNINLVFPQNLTIIKVLHIDFELFLLLMYSILMKTEIAIMLKSLLFKNLKLVFINLFLCGHIFS